MTFVLGLTGGIATGKSTAAAFFKRKGIPVIDADQVAHQLIKPGESGWQAVKDNFGAEFLQPDQTINRQKLAKLVFANQEQLQKLNRLLHPLINREMAAEVEIFRRLRVKMVVLDVPLLYETGEDKLCDRVLVISLPKQEEIKRLRKRNRLNQKEAEERLKSQMPLCEKEARADYIVDNTATISKLEEKLITVLREIKAGV